MTGIIVRNRICRTLAFLLLGVGIVPAGEDISGAWAGGYYGGPLYVVLKQDGAKVTGTAGPSENQQFVKFDNGKLEGGNLTFAIGPLQFDLKIAGDAITGEATSAQENPPTAFPVAFKRVGTVKAEPEKNRGLTFEVASVKVSQSTGGPLNGRGGRINASRGQIVMEDVTLWKCLAFAYEISEDRDYAITGPNWLKTDRYNIVAKVPPHSGWGEVKEMMQNLLASRFKLALHREAKEVQVYALVEAKGGSKLHEVPFGRGGFNIGNGAIKAQSVALGMLSDRLSQLVDRPVQDQTGLKGVYDITLQWTPDEPAPSPGAAPTATSVGPSLFAALQEQLGLRLDPRRGTVDVLVVDHADKVPVEN